MAEFTKDLAEHSDAEAPVQFSNTTGKGSGDLSQSSGDNGKSLDEMMQAQGHQVRQSKDGGHSDRGH
jgi:hypothetical protein